MKVHTATPVGSNVLALTGLRWLPETLRSAGQSFPVGGISSVNSPPKAAALAANSLRKQMPSLQPGRPARRTLDDAPHSRACAHWTAHLERIKIIPRLYFAWEKDTIKKKRSEGFKMTVGKIKRVFTSSQNQVAITIKFQNNQPGSPTEGEVSRSPGRTEGP